MTENPIIKHLQQETVRIVLSGFVLLLVVALALSTYTNIRDSGWWFITSTLLWLLSGYQTFIRLALNRADSDAPLYNNLGWANRLTISRGWLISACGGLLVIPGLLSTSTAVVWMAAMAYSVAAIFDRVDGFIARKTRHSSQLGAELDTVFDALGLLVAPLLALQLGKIHVSYLLVSIAYYLFVTGLKIRKRKGLAIYPLAPSQLRRTLAGFQMAYVAVVLWPPFDAEVTVLAGFGFMLPLLGGFLVDWCVVSGRLQPYTAGGRSVFAPLKHITDTWFLPALRFVLVMTLMLLWPTLSISAPFITTVLILSVALMASGIAGRAGAAGLLMLLAWHSPLPVGQPAFVLCLFIAIAILLLGCGRFSLWQADDHWVNRQDGA